MTLPPGTTWTLNQRATPCWSIVVPTLGRRFELRSRARGQVSLSGLFTTQGEKSEVRPAGPLTRAATKGCPAPGMPWMVFGAVAAGVPGLKKALPRASVVIATDPKLVDPALGKTPLGHVLADEKAML